MPFTDSMLLTNGRRSWEPAAFMAAFFIEVQNGYLEGNVLACLTIGPIVEISLKEQL